MPSSFKYHLADNILPSLETSIWNTLCSSCKDCNDQKHKCTCSLLLIYLLGYPQGTSLLTFYLWRPLFELEKMSLNLKIKIYLLSCSKWPLRSVLNIILIIIYLTFQYWASLSYSKMSFFGSSNSLKAIAQWWFSKTALSLYLNDLTCLRPIKKEFWTPGCPTSCMRQAINPAIN